MTKEKLDLIIKREQRNYKVLYHKLKKCESKLTSLFERRYPNGRLHDSFFKDYSDIIGTR